MKSQGCEHSQLRQQGCTKPPVSAQETACVASDYVPQGWGTLGLEWVRTPRFGDYEATDQTHKLANLDPLSLPTNFRGCLL